MRIHNALLALVCACAIERVVLAHPGHAVETEASHGITHYLTHPDHLAQWLIVGVAIAIATLLIRSLKRPAPAYARKDQ